MANPAAPDVTMQDLSRLPIRAITAFATRCAWRVYPVLEAAAHAPQHQSCLKQTTAALRGAEDFARGSSASVEEMTTLAEQTYEAAADELEAGSYAVFAAAHAIMTAAQTLQLHESKEDATRIIATAWGSYRVLLSFVNGPVVTDFTTGEMILERIRADFDKLLALQLGKFAALGKPVDISDQGPLGPLWPDGLPSWYP